MWIFNLFLYLCFIFNTPAYQTFVDGGATCYVYVGGTPQGERPACFYGGK